MNFYLGTHRPNWLGLLDVPLFVSHRTLRLRKTMPVARARWALDSGGFTELSRNGKWETTPHEYVASVRRYQEEIGNLDWCAPQDWMCEPFMLELTGLTIRQHQALTVMNFLELREQLGTLVIPILQGWQRDDYSRHVEDYARAGVNLEGEDTIGVGSVCRRQHSAQIEGVMSTLHSYGLKLHGFGVKTAGLSRYADLLGSADSMAWSYAARRRAPLPGCDHQNCANCEIYALAWRKRILDSLDHAPARLWSTA